jgi:SHS2 domain-containing protein
MWRDPIVEEVRKAREELFKQANYDLHTFFENLKKIQEERKVRTVLRVKEKTACSKMSDVIKFTQCQDK